MEYYAYMYRGKGIHEHYEVILKRSAGQQSERHLQRCGKEEIDKERCMK